MSSKEKNNCQSEEAERKTAILDAVWRLNKLGRIVLSINQSNGWNSLTPKDWRESDYKIPALMALIGTEVSEAVEAFRNDDKDNFGEELADVVIRVLDCAAGLEMDIGAAIARKLAKNAQRGYRHGGKRV